MAQIIDEHGVWEVTGNTRILIEPSQAWIDAHTVPLSDVKDQMEEDVDAKTDTLIADGFSISGMNFKLNSRDQVFWIGRALQASLGESLSGKKVSAAGRVSKEFTDNSEFLQFFAQGFGTVEAIADRSIYLKEQIEAAETVQALETLKESPMWLAHFA